MADEASGFWKSCQQALPEGILKRMVSCTNHFSHSVQRKMRLLSPEEIKDRFRSVCDALSSARSEHIYSSAVQEMEDLVTVAPAELAEWWSFWHAHESHVFSSKRPTFKAPLSNKAEIGNTFIRSIGSYFCTLIQAARDDVARSLMFESDWQSFQEGRKVGGKGSSTVIVEKKHYKKQEKASKEYIDEFKEFMAGKIQLNPSHDVPEFVSESSSHRPDPILKKRKTSKKKDSSDNPYRVKPKPTKSFEKRLSLAKNYHKRRVHRHLRTTEKSDHHREYEISTVGGGAITVKIKKDPECSCSYINSREVCSHVVWVLLYVLKIDPSSELLYQRGYSNDDLNNVLFKGACKKPETEPESDIFLARKYHGTYQSI